MVNIKRSQAISEKMNWRGTKSKWDTRFDLSNSCLVFSCSTCRTFYLVLAFYFFLFLLSIFTHDSCLFFWNSHFHKFAHLPCGSLAIQTCARKRIRSLPHRHTTRLISSWYCRCVHIRTCTHIIPPCILTFLPTCNPIQRFYRKIMPKWGEFCITCLLTDKTWSNCYSNFSSTSLTLNRGPYRVCIRIVVSHNKIVNSSLLRVPEIILLWVYAL